MVNYLLQMMGEPSYFELVLVGLALVALVVWGVLVLEGETRA